MIAPGKAYKNNQSISPAGDRGMLPRFASSVATLGTTPNAMFRRRRVSSGNWPKLDWRIEKRGMRCEMLPGKCDLSSWPFIDLLLTFE